MDSQKTISVLVNDQPGVMNRVTSLFTRRGFNMESITVGASEEVGVSRITIVTSGDDRLINQILNQLLKLIDVYEATLLTPQETVRRELAFMKMRVDPSKNDEIVGIVKRFEANVVDIGTKEMIIQAVGDTERINTIVEQLTPYGMYQLSRTGVMAMEKGR